MSVRHLDQQGVLAFCFNTFTKYGLKIAELENVAFDDRKSHATNLVFKGEPGANASKAASDLVNNPAVLDVKF